MTVHDLFSKRQKRLRGEVSDVYTYDEIPQQLRVQIIHILDDALGDNSEIEYNRSVDHAYDYIATTLRREYGVFELPHHPHARIRNGYEELREFILYEPNAERVLDAVELSSKLATTFACRGEYRNKRDFQERATAAIEELNRRFLESGVGYQFAGSEIIRVDSEFMHSQVVLPAISLLSKSKFAGAQEEFLKAHEHYRHRRAKEALNECLKAFESTMKIICETHGWPYDNTKGARSLIAACLDNQLIPPFWEQHYSSLRSMLESGVPTGRNRNSGHGQGSQSIEVPDYLVAYMLHMTASAIVFLAEADAGLSSP